MRLLNNAHDDRFVKAQLRFDRWAADQLPIPGALAIDLVRDFLTENKVVEDQLQLGGDNIRLGRITIPLLHVTALYDHIVPKESSQDLIKKIHSQDKTEIIIKGGHVSLIAGSNAIFRLWPQLDKWLGERNT